MLAREQPAPSAASVVAGVCAQSPGVAEQQADPAMAEAGLSGTGVDAKVDAAVGGILRGADVLGSSYESLREAACGFVIDAARLAFLSIHLRCHLDVFGSSAAPDP
jgi:hypothetical protein